MAKFEKNNSLGKGRPKGSLNKVSQDIRESFLELLQNNVPQMQKDLNELTPYERWRILLDIASYCTPKMRAIELKKENRKDKHIQSVEMTVQEEKIFREEIKNFKNEFDEKYM